MYPFVGIDGGMYSFYATLSDCPNLLILAIFSILPLILSFPVIISLSLLPLIIFSDPANP
jgi:hypothetical protein